MGARYTLGLLLVISVVNHIDRQVMNILIEPVRKDRVGQSALWLVHPYHVAPGRVGFAVGREWLRRLLDPVRPTILRVAGPNDGERVEGADPAEASDPAGAIEGQHESARCKVIHLPDPNDQTRSLLGLKEGGLFLIRPDGHLAARGVTLETLEASKLMRLAPNEAPG